MRVGNSSSLRGRGLVCSAWFGAAIVAATGVAAWGSTLVGHPVPTQVASGTGLVYTSGLMAVSSIVYDHCAAADETVDVDEILDPVAGDTIVLTPGQHCKVRLYLSERFELYGTGPSNSDFGMSLGVGFVDLTFDPPVTVPTNGSSGGTAIELGYPDWVTASSLGLDPNEHLTIGAGSSLHDSLRSAIRNGSDAW